MPQVHLRTKAVLDVEHAVAHLADAAGADVAASFIDDLEAAVRHIAGSPHSGSGRFAHELGIPELRAWRLRHHPYLLFYVPTGDRIDVWRVLHERRDATL